ncbi:DUF763 domain-containing protein [[Eubacterium] cellulosolvens]
MHRAGSATLRLHGGKAPYWLVNKMTRLSQALLEAMAELYGSEIILTRLSDPLFFQACSNVLGFDWDSSGSTTVTCGVLKNALDKIDIGVKAVGGKGKRSNVMQDLNMFRESLFLSEEEVLKIGYASKTSAKVDTSAIQSGYSLYHHSVFADNNGNWAIIQQGMRPEEHLARRFHWLSNDVDSFVIEPHKGIVGVKHDHVLDMTASDSAGARRACIDLVNEKPSRLRGLFQSVEKKKQSSLRRWMDIESIKPHVSNEISYSIPTKVNWRALESLYINPPDDFEELLGYPGVGPATIRGLAFLSELLFGEKPSWKDPVKYSFAFGGKDGIPFPVDRRAMDNATEILKSAVESAKLGSKEKFEAISRIRY